MLIRMVDFDNQRIAAARAAQVQATVTAGYLVATRPANEKNPATFSIAGFSRFIWGG